MKNKKIIGVLAPFRSDFMNWKSLNANFDDTYIYISKDCNTDQLLGREFDEIIKTKRWYLIPSEIIDLATSRCMNIKENPILD